MPPRAVFKVQGAPNKTRWTLSQNEQQRQKALEVVTTMQGNGAAYYDHHESPLLPRYESYDGSQYSMPGLDRTNSGSGGWRPPQTVNGSYEGYNDFDTPLEERLSYQMRVNTRLPSQDRDHDVVGQHLLYETAMMETQSFEMLDIAEVDALKKEQARLDARIEAVNRKLALESKVKDAAQNLQRLYSVNDKRRPDTPQSPDSPKGGRNSLLRHRQRTSTSGSVAGQHAQQAEDELAISIQKVEELNAMMKDLLERRQSVERKLLRHTAAVLAEQSARASQPRPLTNGHARISHDEEDRKSVYSPDEFDGIRDILNGAPASANGKTSKLGSRQKLEEEHAQQMASVQSRLEQLNEQLQQMINEAGRTRGVHLDTGTAFVDSDGEPTVRLDKRLDRLEDNVHMLAQEQESVKAHYARVQDSAHMTRNAVEEQLESVNHHLHNTLLLGADMLEMESVREPPQATGHGYQHQLQYLDESLQTMERLLRQHRHELDNAREVTDGASRSIDDAHAKAAGHAQKVDEYEATLGGLWEILQSDIAARRPSTISSPAEEEEHGLRSPGTPLKEDFSLQAFSARVQHLFDRAQSAKEQQDILRRQIQQQRELNGKSDAEKDRQLTDLQGQHDQLALEHGSAQEELTKAMTSRAQAESEASQSKLELINVMNEFEGVKKMVDARQLERDELSRQLQTHQGNAVGLQERAEELEAQIADLTDDARIFAVESEAKAKEAEARHADVSSQLAAATSAREVAEQRHGDLQKDMENLESEIVRLTTELTMAKAELEGAYGSRAERAREAQAAEVVGLNQQNQQLGEDLKKLQADHEGLRGLHEALGGEHETLRNTHEATLAQIEHLRSQATSSDRSKNLEAELHDMTDAFQELTRESVQLEQERHQLDDLIDGLRDRCDALEAQLGDEKVRWLGIKSPGAVSDAGYNGREQTSVMVLRQEFKKMMREARAEGVRLLRAEQEQRRQAEAELRRLRQANGPLAGAGASVSRGVNGLGSTPA